MGGPLPRVASAGRGCPATVAAGYLFDRLPVQSNKTPATGSCCLFWPPSAATSGRPLPPVAAVGRYSRPLPLIAAAGRQARPHRSLPSQPVAAAGRFCRSLPRGSVAAHCRRPPQTIAALPWCGRRRRLLPTSGATATACHCHSAASQQPVLPGVAPPLLPPPTPVSAQRLPPLVPLVGGKELSPLPRPSSMSPPPPLPHVSATNVVYATVRTRSLCKGVPRVPTYAGDAPCPSAGTRRFALRHHQKRRPGRRARGFYRSREALSKNPQHLCVCRHSAEFQLELSMSAADRTSMGVHTESVGMSAAADC